MRELDFAKGKRPVVKVGGNSGGASSNTSKEKSQKPPPNTILKDIFKKFHKGHPQGK